MPEVSDRPCLESSTVSIPSFDIFSGRRPDAVESGSGGEKALACLPAWNQEYRRRPAERELNRFRWRALCSNTSGKAPQHLPGASSIFTTRASVNLPICGALKASYTDELTAIINGRRRGRENASLGCVPRNLPPSTIAADHPLNDQRRANRSYRPCTHARDGDRSGWSIDQ